MTQTWAQRNPERARELGREAYRARRPIRHRSCIGCGADIPPEEHGRRKFCSKDCRRLWDLAQRRARTRDRRSGRLCARCGEEIPAERNAKATTCSTQCRDALNERRQMHAKCRALSNYAVRIGRLVKQPCEVCGDENVEIHHIDYLDPLDVRWLCFVHHRNLMHGTSIPEGSTHG